MAFGNGSMTVKVDSLTHTDDWTKAGIMIRETHDAGSASAMVGATGGNGSSFQARTMADQDATFAVIFRFLAVEAETDVQVELGLQLDRSADD